MLGAYYSIVGDYFVIRHSKVYSGSVILACFYELSQTIVQSVWFCVFGAVGPVVLDELSCLCHIGFTRCAC